MAGSPKKRARREAAEARAQGLAPVAFVDGAPGAPTVRNLMSKEEFEADRRRPHVAYSEELAMEYCVGVASGMSMIELSSMEGMPSRRSVLNWRRAHPEFAEALTDALKFRADMRLTFIDGLVEDIAAGNIDPIAGRVIFDCHKWLAGKENYKYSDTQKVELTGANGGAIQISTDPVRQMELARWLALILENGERATKELELQPGEFEKLPHMEESK